jgi:hypothetical protein
MVSNGTKSIEEGHLVHPSGRHHEVIVICNWAKQVLPFKMLSFSLQEP